MLFPDVEHNDIVNVDLRQFVLSSQERGERVACWHGRDTFTGQDVEALVNLDKKKGGVALEGQRKAHTAEISEKGKLLLFHFLNKARGIVEVDIHAEALAMNLERTGIEVFNDGETAHLRLFDKLSGDDILKLDGDDMHELVDQKVLDPRDYHGSAFKHAEGVGLL